MSLRKVSLTCRVFLVFSSHLHDDDKKDDVDTRMHKYVLYLFVNKHTSFYSSIRIFSSKNNTKRKKISRPLSIEGKVCVYGCKFT